MRFYGLWLFTHGGQKALAVMSSEGNEAVRRRIRDDEGAPSEAEPGRITIYFERIAGTLDRLISLHGIEVLDKPAWDARKAALGDAAKD